VRFRRAIVAGWLAGGLIVPAALGGDGGDLRGASFEVSASAGSAAIRGRGVVDLDAPLGGGGSLRATRGTGERKAAITLQLSTWRLSFSEPDTILVLGVRVGASSSPSSCPVGSRGTVSLVDAGGGGDTVQAAFRSGRCRPFARVFSSDAGDRVSVTIGVIRR